MTTPAPPTARLDVRGFAAAFDSALAELQVCVEEAWSGEEEWPVRVAAATRAALCFAAAEPAAARVLTIEAIDGGKVGLARHGRMIDHFAAGLRPGRAMLAQGESLPEITEKVLVGGVASLVAERLHACRHWELPDLAPDAIQMLLLHESPSMAREGTREHPRTRIPRK